MNASKDLWSISAESNEMPMEVDQVPLKGLAQAQRGSTRALGWWSCRQPRPGVTLLLSQQGLTTTGLYGWPLTTLINAL